MIAGARSDERLVSERHISSGNVARRINILRVLLALTIIFGLFFAPLNFAQNDLALGALECVMVLYALIIHRALARRLPYRIAVWAFLLPFLSVLLFALYDSASNSVFIWALLIPSLSHRLLGTRPGSIAGLIFLALAALVLLVRFDFRPTLAQTSALADVMLCSATLFFISFVHERQLTRADRQLRERADLDSLTRLATRRRFRELFEQARRRAETERSAPLAISFVLIDLDYFKRINDTHGHDVGDDVLAGVAARLLAGSDEADRLGRIGGEELAVMMFDLSHAEATRRAETLRRCVAANPIISRGRIVRVTMSVGVATFDLRECSFESMFSETDERLFAAKRAGRNRVQAEPVSPPPLPPSSDTDRAAGWSNAS